MKYFLGLEIPQAQREALVEIMAPTHWHADGLVFVKPSRMHITLRFLGDVPQVIEKARVKLAGKSFPGRTMIALASVGNFTKPPVVWAGVDQNSTAALWNLREDINDLLGGKSKFIPHVTLSKNHYASFLTVDEFLAEHSDFRTDPWLMDRLTLFASPGGGADYQVVETYPIL